MPNNYHKNHHDPLLENLVLWCIALGAFIFLLWIFRTPIYFFSVFIANRVLTSIYFVFSDFGLDTTIIINKLIFLQSASDFVPSFYNIYKVHSLIGSIFNVILSIILFIWLIYCLIVYKYEKSFNRVFDYSSLKKEYFKINPKGKILEHLEEFVENSKKGNLKRSQTYWQFAVFHKIINGSLPSKNATKETFDDAKALSTIQSQIGELHPHPIICNNKVMITGPAKIILAILCHYHERNYKQTKNLIIKIFEWCDFKHLGSGNYKYSMNIPTHETVEMNKIIIQAFTNSQTLDEHDKIRRKEAGEPYINNVIRHSLYIHSFTTTLLMSLFSKMKQVSATKELLWLKCMDRSLYYALHSVGSPSPLPESMGQFFVYEQEQLLFTRKKPLIQKDLSKPFALKTKDIIPLFNWDIIINDFYFELDQTQWVHHEKYLEVDDEDLINLTEREFSFESKIKILLLGKIENKKFITQSLHFKKEDGSIFIEPMKLNQAGMLDESNATKLNIVISSNYIITNDLQSLRKVCLDNKELLKDTMPRGYDALPDACEVLGIKAWNWHYVVKKYTQEQHDAKEIKSQLSEQDYNWYLLNHIEQVISELYYA